MKLLALCDSEICAMKRVKTGTHKKNGKTYDRVELKYMGPQVKHVSNYAVDCPDCRSVLFWTTDNILLKQRQKVG